LFKFLVCSLHATGMLDLPADR